MQIPSMETARSKEGRALGQEQTFWSRDDLIYIGDLSWINQGNPEGFEYMTPPSRSGNKFEYTYGMININEGAVVNELICTIQGQLDQSQTFMMNINGTWVDGPLEGWLNTMDAERQKDVRERYKALINWVYTQV